MATQPPKTRPINTSRSPSRKAPRVKSSPPPQPDPVQKYSEDVVAGRIIAGPHVRRACERHLRDLEQQAELGIFWDLDSALRAINFFPDVLRLAEGEHAGKPFVLELWQQFIVGSLFGWREVETSHRRFRVAYVEIGKGNGKTPLAAGIGLYMLCADGESGAQCFAAATTREQAHLLFQDAVKMVDASPALSARIQQSGKRQVFNLAHLSSGSYFRPVSSENKGLDGKRVHYAAVDELHEHPTATVVEKMRAGTKGRRQALIFNITNSGFNRQSVCYEYHDYSAKILEQRLDDKHWFSYICALDEGDSWQDEKVWIKANPNLGVSITWQYLREQVTEALGRPSKQNLVKRLNFCIWTEQAELFISAELWDANNLTAIVEEQLKGRPCYLALDLASKRDLAALVALFEPPEGSAIWDVVFRFFVPGDNVQRRVERDRVPYDLWIDREYIIGTEGDVIDFDVIRREVMRFGDDFMVQEVAFDPWNATQLTTQLAGDGFTMVEMRQGFATLSGPTKDFEALLLKKQLNHGGHAVAKWMASNLAVEHDASGNLKPSKKRSTQRIDGMVALIMAIGRAMLHAQPGEPRLTVA